MKQYLVYLKNGGVCEESASCIIVRSDCLGSDLVCFMNRNNGYSSLSKSDIKFIHDESKTRISLQDYPHMNTNEFCNFLKTNI